MLPAEEAISTSALRPDRCKRRRRLKSGVKNKGFWGDNTGKTEKRKAKVGFGRDPLAISALVDFINAENLYDRSCNFAWKTPTSGRKSRKQDHHRKPVKPGIQKRWKWSVVPRGERNLQRLKGGEIEKNNPLPYRREKIRRLPPI